uniref:Secreted protein n=1 Tax=Rhipicephalus appendiculatus TaxID=34631 RepID=A0A131YCV2_RHIAP
MCCGLSLRASLAFLFCALGSSAYSTSSLAFCNEKMSYSLCSAFYTDAAMEGIAPRYRAPGLAAALSQIVLQRGCEVAWRVGHFEALT